MTNENNTGDEVIDALNDMAEKLPEVFDTPDAVQPDPFWAGVAKSISSTKFNCKKCRYSITQGGLRRCTVGAVKIPGGPLRVYYPACESVLDECKAFVKRGS